MLLFPCRSSVADDGGWGCPSFETLANERNNIEACSLLREICRHNDVRGPVKKKLFNAQSYEKRGVLFLVSCLVDR